MTLNEIGVFFDELVAKFDAFWTSVLALLGLIDGEIEKNAEDLEDQAGKIYLAD